MSYVTYTTRALVCGHKPSNTSDKSVLLFTKDAGMVWASVRSVREERSKQRYALQDMSEARLSLVKGKSGWRVGSATSRDNFYYESLARENRGGVVSVIKLLRQFVHGEEAHVEVYDDTIAVLSLMSVGDTESVPYYRDLYTYRLLKNLGYIADAPELQSLMTDEAWDQTDIPLPESAHKAIDKAIKASHL